MILLWYFLLSIGIHAVHCARTQCLSRILASCVPDVRTFWKLRSDRSALEDSRLETTPDFVATPTTRIGSKGTGTEQHGKICRLPHTFVETGTSMVQAGPGAGFQSGHSARMKRLMRKTTSADLSMESAVVGSRW